jgi:hypothetical protein
VKTFWDGMPFSNSYFGNEITTTVDLRPIAAMAVGDVENPLANL